MRTITKNRIESIGLIFLLISFGWQTLENSSKSSSAEVDIYQINEKLDSIWFLLSEIYSHSDLNNTSTITRAGFANLMTEWKGWAKLKTEKAKVEEQETVFFCLRLLLYAVGSIMLIVPKLLYSTKVEE